MKRTVLFVILFLLLFKGYAQDKDNWKEFHLSSQPSLYLKTSIAAWEYEIMGLQSFRVKFTNTSNVSVHISGTLTAITYCGTSTRSNFDVGVVKPGQTVGGAAYVLDIFGLTAQVSMDDCKEGVKTPYYETNAEGQRVTYYHTSLIRSIRIDNLKVEKIVANETSGTEKGNTTTQNNRSTTGDQSSPSSTSSPSLPPTSSPTTQPSPSTVPAPPVIGPTPEATQAQADMINSSGDLMRQGAESGNETLYIIGGCGVLIGALSPILFDGSTGAAVGYCFLAAGGIYLLCRGDRFSTRWFSLKTQIGTGYEQLPVLVNNGVKSATDVAEYPMAVFGLKATFFNNKKVSFAFQPYYSHSVNGIIHDYNVKEYQYGGNGTFLIGRSNTGHLRVFLEGGWYQRHLGYTNRQSAMTGSLDYSAIHYGGGIMLWTLNKGKNRESYIKPGIFWERPSFNVPGQPATMVGNVQIMLSSFLLLDCSYSQSYLIGGVVDHTGSFNGPDRNFLSIKLTKSSRLF